MLKKSKVKKSKFCKVTFLTPKSIEADEIYLVGDFNNWNEKATPMEKNQDGGFTITLELEKDNEYHFRYLVNGAEWHNDWEADKYVPNPYIGDNSVVIT